MYTNWSPLSLDALQLPSAWIPHTFSTPLQQVDGDPPAHPAPYDHLFVRFPVFPFQFAHRQYSAGGECYRYLAASCRQTRCPSISLKHPPLPVKMPDMAAKMEAYEVAERVMSGFSLLGSFIILLTFLCWKEFRKPINRLIFFATFGNVAANIATLISTSALRRVHPNAPMALCQFQGVLIQW